jgi:hypothetical protein
MYSTTRATMTLIGAGVAGLLIWVATRVNDHTTGGYWAVYGIIAAAGLTMALSQLFGGWTKWGWPRMSVQVFLLGFLPALIAGGWILLGHQPHPNWFRNHVLTWSGDIGIRGFVRDLGEYIAVIAFGLGLTFGITFDTLGPRRAAAPGAATTTTPAGVPVTERDRSAAADEPMARERRGGFLRRRERATTR